LKHRIRNTCKKTAAFAAIAFLVCLNYSDDMRTVRMLPDTLYLTETTNRDLGLLPQKDTAMIAVDAQQAERLADVASDLSYTYRLFGVLPIRTVNVVRTTDTMLVPGGEAVGITLHTAGVLVVGLGTVETADGAKSPAAAAGLQAGDTIVTVNGEKLRDAKHFSACCSEAETLQITVQRNGEEKKLTLHPEIDKETGLARIGAWVRDSTAGIGTLSFCSEDCTSFAALGHAVSDIDTQSMLTVGTGELLGAEVVDVIRGKTGEPGELLGVFAIEGEPIGSILHNTEFGVFGVLSASDFMRDTSAVPMAFAYEAHTGAAELVATVDGSGACRYACEITRVNVQQSPAAKGMIVTVTDPRLLDSTGGIVQGMSGSPVLQDGKLVGVVTHVFVNDPTKGYCIYAEWMVRELMVCDDRP